MSQKELRTYRRRKTTRESGYHTCEETTGGECLVLRAEKLIQPDDHLVLEFSRNNLKLIELFGQDIGMIGFGGYIRSTNKIAITYSLRWSMGGHEYFFSKDTNRSVDANTWTNIGFHKEISLDHGTLIDQATVIMSISGCAGNELQFIAFDFDVISKGEFLDGTLATSFYQKTSMHIPYLYYLDSQKHIGEHLKGIWNLTTGDPVVLKSCNRCGRFLPIDVEHEMNTLSFSLHCRKRAPCRHSTFRAYTILNYSDLSEEDLSRFKIERDGDKVKIISYFGHQLECKACKKFFVNAPLNPLRTPQQYKEDGLRRRAIEVLVNELLNVNLVHFDFEHRTKKQFSEYIWKQFDGRCFKCQAKVPFEEMHLDHTMPLAYLYRLDESATCLCSHHNAQKRDRFPVDFYTEEELNRLSRITGLSMDVLHHRGVNEQVLALLVKNVVWYFDEFLMRDEYQKKRDGILTADKINVSLQRVIEGQVDLAEEYKRACGRYPTSVTIQ